MSTLIEIRTNIQANWPTNYHSSVLVDGKIDEYINRTQRWVARGSLLLPNNKHLIHNFSFLKREITANTVDGQRRYALPIATSTIWEFKREISLELIDANSKRVPLTRAYKTHIEDDYVFRDTTATGTPRKYSLDDDDIWLYPLPDHSRNGDSAWTLNLEYYGYPADLSADTDNNKITNAYPEVLEYGATEMGYRYGKDTDEAEYWRAKKIEIFLEMVKVDQSYENAGIEEGIHPAAGQSLSSGGHTSSGEYWQDTPYE